MVQYIIFQQRQFENRIPQRVAKEAEMQVGDLVIYRDGTHGIIMEIDNSRAQVFCYWADGESSWCLKWYVEAV